MVLRRTVAVLALITLLSAGAGSSQAASLSGLETRHARLQQEIAGERSTLDSTTAAVQQVQARLAAVDTSLAAARSNVANIDVREMQLAGALVAGQARLASLDVKLADQRQEVNGVLRYLAENGTESYLSVLLGAHSFSGFLTRVVYLRSLFRYETGLLREFHAEQTEAAAQVASLEQAKSNLTALARSAQAAEAAYQGEARQRGALLDQLAGQRTVEEALVKNLEQKDTALMEAIKQLEAAAKNLSPGDLRSMVAAVAGQYGVDPALVWDIIREESGGDAGAVSRAGAEGLMQLMPGTAAEVGVTDPLNPEQNIRGGVAYFSYLLKLFHGNVALALAAYNAGPGAVKSYHGVPPYQETQKYVEDILSHYQKAAAGTPGPS